MAACLFFAALVFLGDLNAQAAPWEENVPNGSSLRLSYPPPGAVGPADVLGLEEADPLAPLPGALPNPNTATVIYDVIHRTETVLADSGVTATDIAPNPEGLMPLSHSTANPGIINNVDGRVHQTPTTSFPHSAVVKIMMRFGGAQSMCSGAMVDEFHVLTAGHCVHTGGKNGQYMWAEVDGVRVLPGLNDGWFTEPYEDKPLGQADFGFARVTVIRSYAGWTSGGDYNHDWALLTLDRPVGIHTNWFGYATASTASTWYQGTLFTAGYPFMKNEGRTMQRSSETGCAFDFFNAFRHKYNLDATGGQSGSPVWMQYQGGKYILSVVSTASTATHDNCSNAGTRLDQDKFDRLGTWLAEDSMPGALADLAITLSKYESTSDPGSTPVILAPAYLRPASTTLSGSVPIRNNGVAGASSFSVKFYASQNPSQAGANYLLASTTVPSLAAFASQTVNVGGTIPAAVPEGTYYVTALVDASGSVAEYGEGDNMYAARTNGDFAKIRVDGTPPSVSLSKQCSAPGNDGWCRAASEQVSTSASDYGSGLAYQNCYIDGSLVGCGTITVASQGTHTVSITAADLAGNTASTHVVVKLDNIWPTCGSAFSGTPGENGWSRSSGSLTLVLSDATSGVAWTTYTLDGAGSQAYTSPFAISGDGTHTSNCVVGDQAGNVGGASIQVAIDSTAPGIMFAQRSPNANSNGWNQGTVTVTWTCSDGMSGPTSSSVSKSVGMQGAAQAATGTCLDLAGNHASSTYGGINIDWTAPLLSGSRTPLANANGWNNVDVTVSFACTDSLSGVAVAPLTPQVVAGEGANQARSAGCTDKAGNAAPTSTVGSIQVDKTPPTVAGSRLPAPNGAGWNNVDVTVSWMCTDGLSGANNAASQVVSSEGLGQSRSSFCTDLAGNPSSTSSVGGINIDKTPPTAMVSGACMATGNNGWCRDANAILATGASDSLSGVVSQACTKDAAVVPCGAVAVGQGAHTVCDTPVDVAGNAGLPTCRTLRLDNVAPLGSVTSACTVVGSNGWCLDATGVAATHATDATSGMGVGASQTCTLDAAPVACGSVPLAQGAHTVCDTPTDVAGNVGVLACMTGKLDNASPAITGTRTPAPNGAGWNKVDVTVSWTCSDASSGVSNPIQVIVSSEGTGQSRSASCTDHAGNPSLISTVAGINIDKTAPTATVTAVCTVAGTNGWCLDATGVATTAASDATSGMGPDASQSCTLDGAAVPCGSVPFGQGVHSVCDLPTDVAGNVGIEACVTRKLEILGPIADFSASAPAACDPDGQSFLAAGTPNLAPLTRWEWDFGDGTPHSNGISVTHAFAAAGEYVVRLVVTDEASLDGTAQQTIQAPAAMTCGLMKLKLPKTNPFDRLLVDVSGVFGSDTCELAFSGACIHGFVMVEPSSGGSGLLRVPTGTVSVQLRAADSAGVTVAATPTKAGLQVLPALQLTKPASVALGALKPTMAVVHLDGSKVPYAPVLKFVLQAAGGQLECAKTWGERISCHDADEPLPFSWNVVGNNAISIQQGLTAAGKPVTVTYKVATTAETHDGIKLTLPESAAKLPTVKLTTGAVALYKPALKQDSSMALLKLAAKPVGPPATSDIRIKSLQPGGDVQIDCTFDHQAQAIIDCDGAHPLVGPYLVLDGLAAGVGGKPEKLNVEALADGFAPLTKQIAVKFGAITAFSYKLKPA